MLLTEKQNHGLTQFVKAALSYSPAASISEVFACSLVLEVGRSLHPSGSIK